MKERNVTIDIMKGIGIILMVVGHSGYLITESKLNVIKK